MNVTALETNPLKRLERQIEKDLEAIKEHKSLMVDATLSLAAHMKEARDEFPSDNTFGVWLDKNPHLRAISKDDRAALLNFAKDLKLARQVLGNTSRSSLQHIWRVEGQSVYEEKGLIERVERKPKTPQKLKEVDLDDEPAQPKVVFLETQKNDDLSSEAPKPKIIDAKFEKFVPVEPELPTTGISPILRQQFSNGEVHSIEELTKTLNVPEDEVVSTLTTIRKNPTRHGLKVKKEGEGYRITLLPHEKMISYTMVKDDLSFIIADIKAGTYSHQMMITALENLMEKWGK